jgi:hypothetical protein
MTATAPSSGRAATGIRCVAVWIDTPLHLALARNSLRPTGEIVPETATRSVFGLLEAPTADEGFAEVIVVDGDVDDA